MRELLARAALVVIAAAGVATIAGCDSQTAADSQMQQPAKVVTDEMQPEESANNGGGMAAIEKAAQAEKYLFALFWKEENAETAAMRSVLQEAMKELADKADSVEVEVTAGSERAIVEKFDLDRAPMPLILAIAPNGAVTGGFPTKVEDQELREAFASPCTQKCMKALQNRRLVFLCVQNTSTNSNDDAMQGVRDFKASPDRAEKFKAAAQKAGVTVKELYWTMGICDVVMILEAADDKTAAAALVGLVSLGNVKTQTMRAFSPAEMREILSKTP